ncbi:hypothetical protein Vretimale_5917 [Volvox reticuliferus]|uniref:Vacuolar sorting protein 39/Transforming growth factor beta receptor-associated domain-containing protein n=1 Tax=Volvox reticuliferus TaxID=1737510 RepID=A0A8J4LK37_9CHLO|nr:hypothetical protein Vretimale_5917 [Volvox reticuliferus]
MLYMAWRCSLKKASGGTQMASWFRVFPAHIFQSCGPHLYRGRASTLCPPCRKSCKSVHSLHFTSCGTPSRICGLVLPRPASLCGPPYLPQALHVLRSRPLPVADVMSLLQGRYDGVRWQYLHHLVYGGGITTSSPVASTLALPAESDNSAVAEKGLSEPAGTVGAEVMATSAAVAWQLDPALHTELALELIDCIGLLHTRSRQQHHREGQPDPPGSQLLPEEQDAGLPTVPAAIPSSALAYASTASTEAVALDEPPAELPPALPPLPLPPPHAARHTHTGHDGAAAAVAVCTCSSPPMFGGPVGRRLSPVPHMPHVPTHPQQQSHPPLHLQQSQHHQQQQQRGFDRLRVVSHAQSHTHPILSPAPSRPSPGPVGADRSGGEGAALVPYGNGGVHYAPAGPGVSGAAAAAAAAAATAASSVYTSELPWLGTLGVLPAAAVTRQFVLAVNAARVAAGRDPAPEPQVEVDAAACAGVGGMGDSLSLLRALSHHGDGAGIGTLAGLRAVLQYHLYCSTLYDATIVLQAIVSGGSSGGGGGQAIPPLLREQVQLHSRLADHPAALAVLALQLRDVDSAICYCRARCGQEGWLALLDLLLRPGAGREPDYSAACRVLAAEGAALAPLQVLEALSDDMPLHMARETLSRMVGSVLHRKRQGQVLRALHRAQNLALRGELAQLQANRVLVVEETLCRGCQRALATQVFYRYPSGVVLCARWEGIEVKA